MREKLLMDRSWKFHKGEVTDQTEHGYLYTYMHTKTERGRGPASADYDDSLWESVELPHDYVVEGTPTPDADPVHGSLKRENAWYRRFFRLDRADRGKSIHIEFEGICTQSRIWVNGCYMGMNDSAYTEIDLDITDICRYGDDLNEVSVYVDNTEYEGWWYEGGGIYRHVWLVKTEPVAVDYCGVFIHPESEDIRHWTVPIETTIRNDSFEERHVRLVSKVCDYAGNTILEEVTERALPKREKQTIFQKGAAEDPKLWSIENPALYQLKTQIWEGETQIDEVITVFGFRKILFDTEKGFFLNGVPTKIKGMCIHEDHGGLGVALPDNIKEYRVRRLKEMGCNGYRFSHNPHSRQTLDACDRLGMLVMDENRWFESSQNGMTRLENMIMRDRNHPSVVIWSVGNEEPLQAGERGRKIMNAMKHAIHRLDGTRPVLMAMHSGLLEDGAARTADMIGMNYNIDWCEKVHKKHPDKAMIFAEVNNASEEDILGDRVGGIHTWKILDTKPYMSGMFAWTGMDYRGEHDYPGLFAPCGCMDQNGYAKNSYYLYQIYWKKEPGIYIQPHWNDKKAGEDVLVRVFASGDEVTLYLNGKEIGTRKNDAYFQTDWNVRYEPGILKAVTRKNGVVIAETERQTTKDAEALCLKLENPQVKSGCREAAIITVLAVDKDGREVPDARCRFRVTGLKGARLLVTGNGDVKDQSDRRLPECSLYEGKAQILAEIMEPEAELSVEAEGMRPVSLKVCCEAGVMEKEVEQVQSRYITNWEMAEWSTEKPERKEGNYGWMHGWNQVEVGHGTQLKDLSRNSGFLTYHCRSEIPKERREEDLYLQFEVLEGTAEVFVELKKEDGTLLQVPHAEKPYPEPDGLRLKMTGYEEAYQADIWVCMEIFSPFHGIMKPVRWEYEMRNTI